MGCCCCNFWTKTPPDKLGWYWFQLPHREPEIVKVEKDADERLIIWFSGSETSSMLEELDDVLWGPRVRHPSTSK